MSTNIDATFIEVFKNGLRIIPRTLSIKTLLSERNLKRINYKPYYQRNYVWDLEKQTFFIESVLLGTEIPPLILYKSGASTEVIDGRQRFETLKRFKENEFLLSSKGLMDLPALSRQSFNALDDELKEIYLNSYIRVFEFEVITNVSPEVEDKIKKEIFRRYNTGITPLTSVEVDGAKYDNDAFSNELEDKLCKDMVLFRGLHNCFFPNDKNDENLRGKLIDFLRKTLVMPKFPISRYARSTERRETMELLYDSMFNAMDNTPNIDSYLKLCKSIIDLHDKLSSEDTMFSKQKLMYETILWAFLICQQEEVVFDIANRNTYEIMKQHYKEKADLYSDDNSFHYRSIIDRYEDTASFFKQIVELNFDSYIRNSEFSENLKKIKQGEGEVKNVVQQLAGLRINKPSPIAKPVEEVLSDVVTTKYLLRPTYQRQEKITEQKASSIIESILLGISLPPVFVYKKNDGVKEVVDGQQRLLSIIAFLGKQYRNEEDKLVYSKNNSFKLKKLKILTDYNGLNYSSLPSNEQDKILDFVIDEIIIEQSINAKFDPTDLFIRLNQKPYPIQQNSFEMWNSTVDKSIIEKIKDVTNKHISWFFSKETNYKNRTDRMENEELIALLSYIDFSMSKDSYDKVLGTFKRIDRITCRIKDKNTISDYLVRLEDNSSEKELFLSFIDKTDNKIKEFGTLFESLNKDTLNTFFNVKNSKTFRRSYQDFYIVWLVLHNRTITHENKVEIKQLIIELLCLLRNTTGQNVDENYYDNFANKLKASIITA